jgi:hypothetical protein
MIRVRVLERCPVVIRSFEGTRSLQICPLSPDMIDVSDRDKKAIRPVSC